MGAYQKLYEHRSGLVPWILRNVREAKYECNVDRNHNPVSFEIGPNVSSMTVERMGSDLAAVYGEDYTQLRGLKLQRTTQQLAVALEPFVGPVIATRQAAALAEAEWDAIVRFVHEQAVRLSESVASMLVKDRLAVGTASARRIEAATESRDGLAAAAQEYVIRELEDAFPGLAARLASLRIIGAVREAPASTNICLNEASRCFVYGQFLAMLVLCRSVLEDAPHDRVAAAKGGSY